VGEAREVTPNRAHAGCRPTVEMKEGGARWEPRWRQRDEGS